MQKDEFKAGEFWAYRKSTSLEHPAERVELVLLAPKGRTRKVKVRYTEGELEGLEKLVPAPQLRCPWREWKKVERDERREAALIDSVDAHDPLERVVLAAANEVFQASGEPLFVEEVRGYTRLWHEERSALTRLAARSNLSIDSWTRSPSFVDRRGVLYLPDEKLVTLAICFAKAEPESVVLRLDNEEQTHLREGYFYGERYPHDELLKRKPIWTLARSWAASAGGRDPLREELKRVSDLLYQALAALEKAGETRTATRIQHAWEGKR